MTRNSRFILITSLLFFTQSGPAAAAGKLEELLAIPAIQALLNKQVDLVTSLGRCKEAAYAQKNAVACQQAIQAQNLARLSPELRSILTKPALAASIRELCGVAYGTPKQNSVLCSELFVADPSYEADLARARAMFVDSQRDKP